jgi:hypothetical protein
VKRLAALVLLLLVGLIWWSVKPLVNIGANGGGYTGLWINDPRGRGLFIAKGYHGYEAGLWLSGQSACEIAVGYDPMTDSGNWQWFPSKDKP